MQNATETAEERERKNIRNRIRRGKLPRLTCEGRVWEAQVTRSSRKGAAAKKSVKLGRRGTIKFVA